MSVLHHSANGLTIALPQERVLRFARKWRALRKRLQPWLNAIRAGKSKRR